MLFGVNSRFGSHCFHNFRSSESLFFLPNLRFFMNHGQSVAKDLRQNPIVSVEYLANHLNDVQVVDASWYMPSARRNIHEEHLKCRLPNSVLFDIDEIANKQTSLPHMLPISAQDFIKHLRDLGITSDKPIITYDSGGQFIASARVWWSFRVFGHDAVGVLQGGLPAWLHAKLPTVSGTKHEQTGKGQGTKSDRFKEPLYHAEYQPHLVRHFKDIQDWVEKKKLKKI